MHCGLGVDELVVQSPLAVHTRSVYIFRFCVIFFSPNHSVCVCQVLVAVFRNGTVKKKIVHCFPDKYNILSPESVGYMFFFIFFLCVFECEKTEWKSPARKSVAVPNSTSGGGGGVGLYGANNVVV